MSDYIKREDAVNAVCVGCNDEFGNEPCEPSDCAIRERIATIPSADVVEVVRCKDCMYYNPYDTTKAYDCERGLLGVMQDDYCSYGAREET